ncbi:MAG: TIGR03067 domain-containing protein [Isosphaeraceae bacterium]
MTALLALAVALGIYGEDETTAELEKLQGTWTLVAMEVDGEEFPAEDRKDWTSEYAGNRLTLRAGETVRRRGIISLDPSRNPKAMNTWDITKDGPFEDQTLPGIYEISGDNLKLCLARPGNERPKEFTT